MAEVAGAQAGVIATRQLRAIGLSKAGIARRLAKGDLHALHRGVYAVGHTALTRRSTEWAAVLACGPDAVLSHRTAAALWGLAKPGKAIEVTTPRSGRQGHRGITIHRSRRLDPVDRTTLNGLPVTSLHRTLVDLADILTQPKLAKAIHEAEIQRAFDLKRLEEAIARVPGRKGRHRLRRACAVYEPPPFTRNRAEELLHELLAEHALPAPQANAARAGYELDLFWPQARLNVEFDGWQTHDTTRAFFADRRRDRALRRAGIEPVRVTWRDLTTGRAELVADLRAFLARR